MILAGDFIPKNLMVHLPDEFKGLLVLANLEGPICADGLPQSNKVGVCLHTSRELFDCSDCSIVRLEGGGVAPRFAFSLANNHVMDYGEEGLRQTKVTLASHGIPFAGAGDNEEEARRPMILEENGKHIAVFCCCERQFGMATAGSAGCAEKGVWLYNAIREIKVSGLADFVIVSCHAANEFSPWPTPRLREFYRSLIDVGADCIHGHHAHVPQGWEVYGGKPIFYGLGNFVVDCEAWKSNRNQLWSLVADLSFGCDGRLSFSVSSYAVRQNSNGLSLEKVLNDERVRVYLEGAKAPLEGRDHSLAAVWQEVAVRTFSSLHSQVLRIRGACLRRLSMRDRLRKLYFLLGDLGCVMSGRENVNRKTIHYGKVAYSRFNCESHAECIATALGVLTGAEPDLRTADTAKLVESLMNGGC